MSAAAPTRPEALELISLLGQGRIEDAIRYGEKLAARYPKSMLLSNMLGAANLQLKRRDQAILWFRKALRAEPNHAETLYNLGITLQEIGEREEAIACFDRLLRVKPEHAEVRAHRLHQLAHICDWDAIAASAHAIPGLGIAGDPIPPFALLALDEAPARHRTRAERWVAARFPQSALRPVPADGPERLRIGYFSADVGNHAVWRLFARMIELHDRARYEIHVYSLGDRASDETHARVVQAADHFHDVASLTDAEIAELARGHAIDIAVDLNGHTTYARTAIFALRAAPIQISCLGYPGTMGAPFIDYIVADRTILPEDQQPYYTEKPIYLPHSYQPQDDRLDIAAPPGRAELGLPEDAFVFCGINNCYKITPDLYDVWMRLLQKVDGSVLWLLKANRWADANLRKEAVRRGVNPDRIIFTGGKPYRDYIAQFRQADLFLDSFAYNAGATASNALWAGLPVITRAGSGYSARMAASLLTGLGLPELITTSTAAYEARAFHLATEPGALAEVKARLDRKRSSAPLYDSGLYTRHLEKAYDRAYRRYVEGQPVDVIDLSDLAAAPVS